jgi:hypothetical protein
VREELRFLLHIFNNPTTYSWSAPTATLIEQEPDFHGWQDACLSGAGVSPSIYSSGGWLNGRQQLQTA